MVDKTRTWFRQWFLNSKTVIVLLITLLCLLIVWTFTKVAWLFKPVGQFFSVIALPVIFAGILYYLLNPIIDWLERRHHVSRTLSTIVAFILIVLLLVWGIVSVVPFFQEQTLSLLKNWPTYWETLNREVTHLLHDPNLGVLKKQWDQANGDLFKTTSEKLSPFLTTTFSHLGNVFGVVGNIVVGLVTMPFILFYLLRDGHNLPNYLVHFLPTKFRKSTLKVLREVNTQVSQYIRGQITVAFFVALLFIAGYLLIGLKYAVVLGVLAGILNLIPYLGSFLAMIPSIVVAAVISPVMLIKVLLVFAVEQTLEGRVISPLILGSSLHIHPVTIIVVLLTSGKIFGLAGVILGIPGYAVLKVLIGHLFEWYRDVSGLYHEPPEEKPAKK
ncbi:AI-2E family transporter [Loigolactobacillus backii]|uniref:AI-2E family transporter n=1 Tax=Loigolactobacillus backii TaxID=375175 RepID=A0A192H5Z6_9LACO|nr:AI-2E family transporter [Loigolactobacillus backii]ANK60063.1 AI-2E family transporter [Loigolactobacillus backii]ANK63411.1 AI-2E family transporter [Loigolactobacillus backii]ANK64946.1 AI-2E family transporter [Loigolactobacillus backii]ANK66553.1 AI-2E family transporter [Loigolactobacillus backii]ANK69584.1 AI-2E family transporter [Loigolactobacillus backii]